MSFIQTLEHISFVVESIGCFVMLLGFCISFIKFLKAQTKFISKGTPFKSMQLIRLDLGAYLLLGLEFMIVGDIIGTILRPNFNELTYLVVIVIIRTMIGYFLGKELENVSTEALEKNTPKD